MLLLLLEQTKFAPALAVAALRCAAGMAHAIFDTPCFSGTRNEAAPLLARAEVIGTQQGRVAAKFFAGSVFRWL